MGSLMDLAKYRFETALSDLKADELLFEASEYRGSINRSYYGIFHSLRSVVAMDNFDSKKHSGIIAYFNEHYVKTAVFEKSVSKAVSTAYRLREKSDYQDFYIVSAEEAQIQLEKARYVIFTVKEYLLTKGISLN